MYAKLCDETKSKISVAVLSFYLFGEAVVPATDGRIGGDRWADFVCRWWGEAPGAEGLDLV